MDYDAEDKTNPYSEVADMVREAERHSDDGKEERISASEYYRGEMNDIVAEDGRSQVVSKDFRAIMKKALPTVVKTILNGTEIVEYLPGGPNDEQGAKQASDFVNHVIVPETRLDQAIYDAAHDAMQHKNGIIKWYYEEKQDVSISSHSGLSEDEYTELAADPEVEVLEYSEEAEQIEGMIIPTITCKIRRSYTKKEYRVEAVAPERWLIHPDALHIDEAPLAGEKAEVTRSDLIRLGYDKDFIMGLPRQEADETEELERRDHEMDDKEVHRPNEKLDYYDLYVRFDEDDDGIAELRHMIFAGGLSERNLLLDEPCDEIQYADIVAMRQPHQREGWSLFDDVKEIQQVKTVLLRQTMDNLYWQNNLQPIYQDGAITDEDAVNNPEFGKPISTRAGIPVNEAIGYNTVPFVAKESFNMLEYMDREAEDRTGINDSSAGLDPDALQNVTATASNILENQGVAQAEFMVKAIATGLQRVFKGILRMIVKHQDKPRTVRLRNEWVSFDPRHWNAEMDCTVNVGLGAGTRERDLMILERISAKQMQLVDMFGPVDNPYVKAHHLDHTLRKFIEAAGLKTPELYFHSPSEEEVQQLLEQARSEPSPEEQKAQVNIQMKQMEIEANRDKERAQMEADLIVADKNAQIKMMDDQRDFQMQQEALASKERIAAEDRAAKMQIEMMKMQANGVSDAANSVNGFGETLGAITEAMTQMMGVIQTIGERQAAMEAMANAPKEVIRDENGDVIGVRPVLQ